MEEETILKWVMLNMCVAFVAIEIEQARPVRLTHTLSRGG